MAIRWRAVLLVVHCLKKCPTKINPVKWHSRSDWWCLFNLSFQFLPILEKPTVTYEGRRHEHFSVNVKAPKARSISLIALSSSLTALLSLFITNVSIFSSIRKSLKHLFQVSYSFCTVSVFLKIAYSVLCSQNRWQLRPFYPLSLNLILCILAERASN